MSGEKIVIDNRENLPHIYNCLILIWRKNSKSWETQEVNGNVKLLSSKHLFGQVLEKKRSVFWGRK